MYLQNVPQVDISNVHCFLSHQVKFLHCITQASCGGGENQFSDSFYTAKVLEMEYPEYYRLLCTAPIDFIDVGKEYYGEFFKLGRHPVFTQVSISVFPHKNRTFMKISRETRK